MKKNIVLEACVENITQGINAVKNGANRIELCENLAVGGTTPSYGTLKVLLKKVNIPIFPMIRPRGGNFIYSQDEINVMIEDIQLFKKLNIKGVVLGVLNEANEIDYPLLKKLLIYCEGLEVTFHKAIDEVSDPVKDVKRLESLGISRILTSGKKETALLGMETICKMINEANKIIIVTAGKVTYENLDEICEKIPGLEFHGKKIINNI